MNIYRNVSIRSSTNDKYPWFNPVDLNMNTLRYHYRSLSRETVARNETATICIADCIQYVPIGYKHIEI